MKNPAAVALGQASWKKRKKGKTKKELSAAMKAVSMARFDILKENTSNA